MRPTHGIKHTPDSTDGTGISLWEREWDDSDFPFLEDENLKKLLFFLSSECVEVGAGDRELTVFMTLLLLSLFALFVWLSLLFWWWDSTPMSHSLKDLSPVTVSRVLVSQSMKASKSIIDPVPDPAEPCVSAPTFSCNLADKRYYDENIRHENFRIEIDWIIHNEDEKSYFIQLKDKQMKKIVKRLRIMNRIYPISSVSPAGLELERRCFMSSSPLVTWKSQIRAFPSIQTLWMNKRRTEKKWL